MATPLLRPAVRLRVAGQMLDFDDGVWHVELAAAPAQIAARHFRRTLPTALEVENAIQTVEDALAPAHRQFNGATLLVDAAFLAPVLSFAGQPEAATLSREDVEHSFSRLAALIQGRPLSQDPPPADPLFAASLLVLRELMHHLDLPAVGRMPAD